MNLASRLISSKRRKLHLMTIIVRAATSNDVASCVVIVQSARLQLSQFEPVFWRPSENSGAATLGWFTHLLSLSDTLFLVSEEQDRVVGFLIARPLPVPPVYEPGGPAALIDDFAIENPSRWGEIGPSLLSAAREIIRARGFAQIVVVCPYKDASKMAVMAEAELSRTTAWWTAQP